MSADYSHANLAMLACVDPWALERQVASGDPDAVRGWGAQFRAAGAAAADAVTLGQRADRTVAGAYRNNGDAVFNSGASTAETRVMLSGGGEKMEEVARVLIDVGGSLATAQTTAAGRIRDVDAAIAEAITRRNAYMIDNAEALLTTPGAAESAEQRFLQQAVEAVGLHGRAIKAAVDSYDNLLASRIGHLREWGYAARPPQRETSWTEDVAGFAGDVGDGVVDSMRGMGQMVDDLLVDPSEENVARYAGGIGALPGDLVHDPLGTLDQVATGGNIGKGQYGNAVGEVLGGFLFGKFIDRASELGKLGRAAVDALPRVPGVLDPARHPSDPGAPFPELTVGEKDALNRRLDDLQAQHRRDFERLSQDPDKNGKVTVGSRDEARIGLDMRDQGRLPADLQRPESSGNGDFYSPSANRYYDIKGLHTDHPPASTADRSRPYMDGYDPANNTKFIGNLERQIDEHERIPIIDTRNANQAAVDDLHRIVVEKGWSDRVLWYP